MFGSTGEPLSSERIRVAVETTSCEGAFVGGSRRARLVPSWDKPSAPAPAPKKRRSATAIAPSNSGTTCPPLCHSIV
eukprot:scaffold26905_cov78-Phaeocystis_antarctica.AAC.1